VLQGDDRECIRAECAQSPEIVSVYGTTGEVEQKLSWQAECQCTEWLPPETTQDAGGEP
jgi:hypothetical protein